MIKKGVVLNFKHNNPVSNAISSVLGNYWTHSGIIVNIQGDKVFIMEAIGTYNDDRFNQKGFKATLRFIARIKEMFGGKVLINSYDKKYLSLLHDQNKIKVLDFNIDTKYLDDQVTQYKGTKYDYFGAFSIGIKRVFSLFGKNYTNHKNTTKKLFCSELCARMIDINSEFNILKSTNRKSFEEVSPQDLSLAYDKLKYFKLL